MRMYQRRRLKEKRTGLLCSKENSWIVHTANEERSASRWKREMDVLKAGRAVLECVGKIGDLD